MNAEPPVAHLANRESSAAARLSQTFGGGGTMDNAGAGNDSRELPV